MLSRNVLISSPCICHLDKIGGTTSSLISKGRVVEANWWALVWSLLSLRFWDKAIRSECNKIQLDINKDLFLKLFLHKDKRL